MINGNTQAATAPVETPEEKLARLISENEALKSEAKATSAMPDSVEFKLTVDGKPLTSGVAYHRTFSTGSKGFHDSGKVVIGGKVHTINVQLVEVKSKSIS